MDARIFSQVLELANSCSEVLVFGNCVGSNGSVCRVHLFPFQRFSGVLGGRCQVMSRSKRIGRFVPESLLKKDRCAEI